MKTASNKPPGFTDSIVKISSEKPEEFRLRVNERSLDQKMKFFITILLCFEGTLHAWEYVDGRHGSFVLTTTVSINELYQAVRLTNDPIQFYPSYSNAIPNFQTLTIAIGYTLTAKFRDVTSGVTIVSKRLPKIINKGRHL